MSSRVFLCPKEGCHITQNEVNKVFDEQVALCARILQQKTKEYTGDDTDRLGAFKAAAALQHCTPEQALAGMLAKHIVSLYDMCFDDGTHYDISTWDEKNHRQLKLSVSAESHCKGGRYRLSRLKLKF